MSWTKELWDRASIQARCQAGCRHERDTARLRVQPRHHVGTIPHRGARGYEAVGEGGTSMACSTVKKEAAAALQKIAMRDIAGTLLHQPQPAAVVNDPGA